jgi:hypothetical protein
MREVWVIRENCDETPRWIGVTALDKLDTTTRFADALQFSRRCDADAFFAYVAKKKAAYYGEPWEKRLHVESQVCA